MPTILTDFLKAHPQYRDGIRRFNVAGRLGADIDPRPLAAFLVWAVANRRCDREKVRDRWLRLAATYPGVEFGPCPV